MTTPRSHHKKPPTVAAPPPLEAVVADEPEDEAAEPSTAAATTAATGLLEGRNRLTPEQVESLNRTYRDVCLAQDEDAKALTRRIVARLRRCSHEELHPGCTRIVIDVPPLPLGDVRINEVPYVGRCEVWYCEAQTIMGMVHQALSVEQARLREDGQARAANLIDLDRGGLAARARAIQAA